VERLALDVSSAGRVCIWFPITDDRIRAFYPAARIPAGTYPWQTVEVNTVSVKAILVAYDFRNHHCNTIGNVAG
jgi:hypothetical protein